MPTTIFVREKSEVFTTEPSLKTDVKFFGTINRKRTERYHKNHFLPHEIKDKKGNIDHIDMVSNSTGFSFRKDISYDKYKVVLPNVWGDMNEKSGFGGAFANIQIAAPYEVFTCAYNRCGVSETKVGAIYASKYIMTKFFRALLMLNKHTKQTYSEAFSAVPVQDFSEPWWNETIAQIDEHLFDKYNVPEDIRDYVRKNIQTRSEENIIGL